MSKMRTVPTAFPFSRVDGFALWDCPGSRASRSSAGLEIQRSGDLVGENPRRIMNDSSAAIESAGISD